MEMPPLSQVSHEISRPVCVCCATSIRHLSPSPDWHCLRIDDRYHSRKAARQFCIHCFAPRLTSCTDTVRQMACRKPVPPTSIESAMLQIRGCCDTIYGVEIVTESRTIKTQLRNPTAHPPSLSIHHTHATQVHVGGCIEFCHCNYLDSIVKIPSSLITLVSSTN